MGLFSGKRPKLHLNEAQIAAISERMRWLVSTFGRDAITQRRVLVPEAADFPVAYDGSYVSAEQTAGIVAAQMDLLPTDIRLDIFAEGVDAVEAGQQQIFIEQGGRAGGLYWGRNETDGLYHIGLSARSLKNPEKMVATLAHEMAHIKLLGEERITENDEPLTDLLTVIFGLGIFNANAAFNFRTGAQSWGYSKLGYLSQMEWGFALAMFAILRGDHRPVWLKHLTKNIQSDFKAGVDYLVGNAG